MITQHHWLHHYYEEGQQTVLYTWLYHRHFSASYAHVGSELSSRPRSVDLTRPRSVDLTLLLTQQLPVPAADAPPHRRGCI
jgi:hypothetical protein